MVEVDGNNELDGTAGKNRTQAGYTVKIEGDAEEGFEITNTYEPLEAWIKVTKNWDDNENLDDTRKDTRVILYKTVKGITRYVEARSNQGDIKKTQGWAVTFDHLPVYENKEKIKYSVVEDAVPGYTTTYRLGASVAFVPKAENIELNGTYTEENPYPIELKNEIARATTEIPFEKRWEDENNTDGMRPETIYVDLWRAKPDVANPATPTSKNDDWQTDWIYVTKKTDTADDHWKGSFTEDGEGNPLPANEWAETYQEVTDTEGKNPHEEGWYVRTGEGTVESPYVYESATDETVQQGTTYYTQSRTRQAVRYYVVEEKITEGDYVQISETGNQVDGFVITNTRERDLVNVVYTKAWDDKSDVDKLRPTDKAYQGYFRLYQGTKADGSDAVDVTAKYAEKMTGPVQAGGQWTYTWTGLPENKTKDEFSESPDKTKLYYFVTEVTIPRGYEAYKTSAAEPSDKITETTKVPVVFEGASDTGNAYIKNRHVPDLVDVKARKIWLNEAMLNSDTTRPLMVRLTLQRRLADNDPWETVKYQDVSANLCDVSPFPGGDFASTDRAATWVYTFRNLDRTNDQNKVWQYRVIEAAGDVPKGYTAAVSKDPEDLNTIINTAQQAAVTGTKVWRGGPDQHDPSEEVHLTVHYSIEAAYAPSADRTVKSGTTYYHYDSEHAEYTAVTNPAADASPYRNGWYEFKDEETGTISEPHIDWDKNNYMVIGLPQYDKYSRYITYWVTEDTPPAGYVASYDNTGSTAITTAPGARATNSDQNGEKDKAYNGGKVINTYDGKTSIGGKKTWIGGKADYHINANETGADQLGLELYREDSEGTKEKITRIALEGVTDPVPLVVKWSKNKGDASYQFGYIDPATRTFVEASFDLADEEGNAYIYWVEETAVPEGYVRGYDNRDSTEIGHKEDKTRAFNGGTIVNLYDPEPAKITPVVTKKVEDMPEDVNEQVKTFTFILAANNSTKKEETLNHLPGPARTKTTVTVGPQDENGVEFNFGELTFYTEGTYTYDLYELAEDGWTSSAPVSQIVIDVTDDNKGKYVARVRGSDEATPNKVKEPIVNTYDPEEQIFVPDLDITKKITGRHTGDPHRDQRDLNKDEFVFTLTGKKAVPNYEEVTTPGTKNPRAEGWYERSGAGTQEEPYVYTPTTDTTVDGTKTYYENTNPYEDAEGKDAAGTNDAPKDVWNEVNLSGVNFDHVGRYLFTLAETRGALPGITYDETTYTVEATVTDRNADGEFEVAWKVSAKKPKVGDEVALDTTSVEFDNIYCKRELDVKPQVQKKLIVPANSRRTLEAGEFSFRIVGVTEDGTTRSLDGANPDGNANVYRDVLWGSGGSGKLTFTIDDLKNENGTFDRERYFHFLVNEIPGTDEKIAYDGTVYSGKLRLYVDTNGELKHQWIWTNEETRQTTAEPLTFDNTYVPDSVSSSLTGTGDNDGKKTVQKELVDPNGGSPARTLQKDEFIFLLAGRGADPADTQTRNASHLKAYGLNQAPVSGKGKVEFPAFPFRETGKYVFDLREIKGADPTIQVWDETSYVAVATVTEEVNAATGKTTGKLKVSWEIKGVNDRGQPTGEAIDPVTFTNKVKPETVDIPVEKVWKGDTRLGVATSQIRPDSVDVGIYIDANGSGTYNEGEDVWIKDGKLVPAQTQGAGKVADKTLKESAASADGSKWTATFRDLPKYDSNKEAVAYSIVERNGGTATATGSGTLKNYTTEYTQPADNDGIAIVANIFKPTQLTGEKEWIDDVAQHDNPREVDLHLWYQPMDEDGDPAGSPVEFPRIDIQWGVAADGNTFQVTNVPKYDKYGHEYTYWFTEDPVRGYADPVYSVKTYPANPGAGEEPIGITNGGKITNKASDTVDVPFIKIWQADTELAMQESKIRPTELTIRLYIDRNNHERYDPFDAETMENQDAEEVYLLGTGENVREVVKGTEGAREVEVKTINSTKKWKDAFEGLPKYDADGNPITYSIAEVAYKDKDGNAKTGVPGVAEVEAGEPGLPGYYDVTYDRPSSSSPVLITDIYRMAPDTLTIEATKEWEGDEDKPEGRTNIDLVLMQTIDGATKMVRDTTGDTTVPQADRVENPQTVATGNLHAEDMTATWKVPKYYGAEEIQYAVEEQDVPEGYTVTVLYGKKDAADPDDPDKVTWTEKVPSQWPAADKPLWNHKVRVINTLVTDTVSVPVRKVWSDKKNQDGLRGEVIVRISGTSKNGTVRWNGKDINGDDVKDLSLNEDINNYRDVFENLPRTDRNGSLITYAVEEVSIIRYDPDQGKDVTLTPAEAGYTPQYKSDGKGGFVITNVHDPNKITVSATKQWSGDSKVKQETRRKVTLHLIGRFFDPVSNEPIIAYDGGTKTISANTSATEGADAGTATWTGLPRKVDNGKTLIWEVYEDAVPGYVMTGGDKPTAVKDAGGKVTGYVFTVRNEYIDPVREVKATKVWEDDTNRDGLRQDVGCQLVRKIGIDGEEEPVGDPQKATEGDNHESVEVIWSNLPETLEGEGKATYEAVELPDDPSSVDPPIDPAGEGWFEQSGDGTEESPYEYTETSDTQVDPDKTYYEQKANTTQRAVFYGVKEYTWNGSKWIEGAPEGYSSAIVQTEPGVFQVTNIHEPEKLNIKVQKVWSDEEDQDKIRPDHITVRIKAKAGAGQAEQVAKANIDGKERDDGDEWQYEFRDLHVYENGRKIDYEVTEDEVDGYYTAVVEDDSPPAGTRSFKIVNTHPIHVGSALTVTKKWQGDEADKSGRGDVTLHLIQVNHEGARKDMKEDKTIAFDPEHPDAEMKAEWKDLPMTYEGQAVSYTVEEEPIKDYTASISDTTEVYTEIEDPDDGLNPAEEGWYEKVGEDRYEITTDTQVDRNKTYYEKDMQITVTNTKGEIPNLADVIYVDPKNPSGQNKMVVKSTPYPTTEAAKAAAVGRTNAPANPSHEGYNFLGWDLNWDDNGNYVMVALYSDVVKPAAPVVSYVDGQKGNPLLTSKQTNDPNNVKKPKNPKHKNLQFVGWKKTVDAGGNIIYVAQYKADCSGGSGSSGGSGKSSSVVDPDGSGSRSARTGDDADLVLWIILILTSIMIMAALYRMRRRDNHL